MLIKIYVNETPIYITDEMNEHLTSLSKQNNVAFFENITIKPTEILDQIATKKLYAVMIYTTDFNKIKEVFFSSFTQIEAAGGIVLNEEKDLLFIFRRGKWDLPKGKMEDGETPEICAAREIEEETGVKNLELKHKIGETYHIYEEKNKMIIKTSHWFYFISTGSQQILPQTAEDIAEVKWIHTLNIKEPMANTFLNIKDILTVFFDTP